MRQLVALLLIIFATAALPWNARAVPAQCSLIADACIEGAETRYVEGQPIYQACWRYRSTYRCGGSNYANYCAPLEQTHGCIQTGSTCAIWGGDGVCNEFHRTYLCGDAVNAGGITFLDHSYTIVRDEIRPQCDALEAEGCQYSGDTCTEGAGTRTINGLAVWKDCWAWRREYVCHNAAAADYCAPYAGAGCTRQGSTCVRSWPNGTCAEYQDQYRCEDWVTNPNGSHIGTPRDIVRDEIINGCSSLQGNGACRETGTTCTEGAATRTINGLPVYKDCWRWRKDFACDNPNFAAECDGLANVGSCVLETGGCSGPVINGVCTVQTKRYRCEDNVQVPGPVLVHIPRDIVRDEVTGDCTPLGGNPSCEIRSTTCLEGPETRTINGLPVYKDCWFWRNDYDCSNPNYATQCDGLANVGSCDQQVVECVGGFVNGVCTQYRRVYRCEDNVQVPGPVLIDTPRDIVRDIIEDGCGSLRAEPNCGQTGERCVEGPETRTINGLPVHKECWRWEHVFSCETGEVLSTCDELIERCTETETECVSYDDRGRCQSWQKTFRCGIPGPGTEAPNFVCGESIYCIDGNCRTVQREQNTDFAHALTWLNLLAKMKNNFDEETMQIFKGENDKCHIDVVTMFNNCCSDSGWGNDVGIAQCSERELALAEKRKAGLSAYVGTYCSSRTFFGVCLTRQRSYCSFQSRLARIVHEQGRAQIGFDWGDPRNPNCDGFTIEQLQQVDWSRIDLSEFFPQLYDQVNIPDGGQMQTEIKNRIEDYYGRR